MPPKKNRVHRVKGKKLIRRYRIFPYGELQEILKNDGVAFFEDSREEPLRRGSVWKAARRLSELIGRKVVASRVLYQITEEITLEGYEFSVVTSESSRQKDISS